ncbi:MAG: outer membrane protein assembly factor BamA [Acidobacteria bacterium]|nr:outer membrane protein assembly factor BamA [Acidobacteriota bacterium]
MTLRRLSSPALAVLCLQAVACSFLLNQRALAQQPEPAKPAAQQPPTPAPKKPANPFENVSPAEPPKPEPPKPAAPKQTPGAKPQLESPKPAAEAPKPDAPKRLGDVDNVIEDIEFRGARRVPQDTLRAMIATRKGDKLDPEVLNRDFLILWNSGRFDDIRLEREPGRTGVLIRFVVQERRVVRSIKYDGIKSVTVSEILDRFKERRVGLQVESQYDPNKVQRAAIVLKEFLSERGRQYATVEPELRQIPPSSLEVTFKVAEGPKVKVGEITIEGNQVFSDKAVIRAMKNLKPVGIPRSILLESMFSKTFDSSKLDEDKGRIQQFYQEKGYFTARATEHTTKMRDVGGGKFRIPLFYPNKPGKKVDLGVTVDEGRRYKLNNINFTGVKFFRTPESLFRPVFQMGQGDIFSTAKLRKGLEQLRKLYGEFGFLDMVPEPNFDVIPNSDNLDLTLTVDEGKQFFVRRIDFSGNTTTRDKVIRRELLIDEGDLFNTRLWEVSLLRLNQLGYFEVLKENEAANITRDTKNNTVDITLKVKERGKNSVQLSGGVSGIAGSFVAMGYSTNNFLGLGETLSLDSQIGDRIRSATFGFTEPYFLDKPLQLGFTVFMQRFNFDQGREVSLLTGRNLLPLYDTLGRDNLLNYVSNGYGFTSFLSYPLRRSFARVGLSYSYSVSNVQTLSTASRTYFEFTNFQGLSGPNTLSGIKQSSLIPSYSYNTVDHPITPSRGKSIYATLNFAGSFLRGNVNMIEPTVDVKYFRSGLKKGHVVGAHVLGRHVTGYGGRSAPPFNRFYMGGENDIRGFEIWGISPIAYVPSEATINVLNDDGSARLQKVILDGQEQFAPVTQRIPIFQLIFPGGDTQLVSNFEYRIPIFGPVTLAGFFDAGINKIARTSQLKLNSGRLSELNSQFPQAGFDGRAAIAPATQKWRASTGIELQVLMPVVNAPFRIYWAYNPSRVENFLQPPVVADRSYFPNQSTFINSVAVFGQASPFFERAKTFRFTIGRTF